MSDFKTCKRGLRKTDKLHDDKRCFYYLPCERCDDYIRTAKNQFMGQPEPERDGIGSTPWDF